MKCFTHTDMYNTVHKVYKTNVKHLPPKLRKNITGTIQVPLLSLHFYNFQDWLHSLRSPIQNENEGPLVQNYQEFQEH